jgi:hypothetical protein
MTLAELQAQQASGSKTSTSSSGAVRTGGLVSCVTALNAIHLTCHRDAVRADR